MINTITVCGLVIQITLLYLTGFLKMCITQFSKSSINDCGVMNAVPCSHSYTVT